MIAIILLYVTFALTVSVVWAVVWSFAGHSVSTGELALVTVLWPLALAILWAEAMGASK